jgi:hypothetical protein
VALVAGAAILGEPVTGWAVAGFSLILGGCVLVATRGRTGRAGARSAAQNGTLAGGRAPAKMAPAEEREPAGQQALSGL